VAFFYSRYMGVNKKWLWGFKSECLDMEWEGT